MAVRAVPAALCQHWPQPALPVSAAVDEGWLGRTIRPGGRVGTSWCPLDLPCPASLPLRDSCSLKAGIGRGLQCAVWPGMPSGPVRGQIQTDQLVFPPRGASSILLRASVLHRPLQPSFCIAGGQGSPRRKAILQKSKAPIGLLLCCVLQSLRT